jgi:hypothetical protein
VHQKEKNSNQKRAKQQTTSACDADACCLIAVLLQSLHMTAQQFVADNVEGSERQRTARRWEIDAEKHPLYKFKLL